MKRFAVALVLALAVAAGVARADDDARMTRLRAGEVLLETDPATGRDRAVVLVRAPWEKLWEGLTDHALLFRIFPDQGDAKVRESGSGYDVLCYTQRRFLIFRFCLRRGIDRAARRIRWEGTEGDLESAAGGWALDPADGGHATLVTFSNDVTLRLWAPKWALKRYNRAEMVRAVGWLRAWGETGKFPAAVDRGR